MANKPNKGKRIDYLGKSRNYPFKIYSPAEVAELLRCSRAYIYKLTNLKVMTPLKARCEEGKNRKFTESFFTEEEVQKGLAYRFDLKKFEQKIFNRLKQGKRIRF